MIVVTVRKQGVELATHRFDGDAIRIGREEDNDIVLESFGCSRHHAEIRRVGGGYQIRDLGSTNGIGFGDRRVTDLELTDGLSLTIGEHTLEFLMPREESPKTMMMPIGGSIPDGVEKPHKYLYLRYRGRGGEKNVKIVEGAEYVLGRAGGVDVVVDDPQCSTRHAVLRWQEGRCLIRDSGSANGTFVNAVKVLESEIRPGDRVKVGQVVIFVDEDLKAAAEEDVLLAKTQIGMPLPSPSRGGDGTVATSTAPLPKWTLIVFAAVVVLAMIGVIGWRALDRLGAAPGEQQPKATTTPAGEIIVKAAPAEIKDFVVTVSAAGTVKPQRQVTSSAEVAARVVSVSVEAGAAVRKGDLLVRLDDREIRLQMEEVASSVSQEQVDLAREDFERTGRLFADGAATRSALDQAKNRHLGLDSAWKSAQARLGQLRSRLSKARITAPIAGSVIRTMVEAGEFVGPGTPVVVIEDTAEVLVAVEVADRDVVRLRPLHVVDATSDAYPGRIFQGVVDRVSTTANPVTRGFEVEARIANPHFELRSGMITSITIVLEKKSCLTIPTQALIDDRGGRGRVYVIEDGVARAVEVSLGDRKDRELEVVNGLVEGDEVVIFGHDQVRDGLAVRTYR